MDAAIWVPAVAGVVTAGMTAVVALANARDPHRRLKSAIQMRKDLGDHEAAREALEKYILREARSLSTFDPTMSVLLGVLFSYPAAYCLSRGLEAGPYKEYWSTGGLLLFVMIFVPFIRAYVRANGLDALKGRSHSSRRHEPTSPPEQP